MFSQLVFCSAFDAASAPSGNQIPLHRDKKDECGNSDHHPGVANAAATASASAPTAVFSGFVQCFVVICSLLMVCVKNIAARATPAPCGTKGLLQSAGQFLFPVTNLAGGRVGEDHDEIFGTGIAQGI
jgi:hypothetical protein